jgi:hypothetical protein
MNSVERTLVSPIRGGVHDDVEGGSGSGDGGCVNSGKVSNRVWLSDGAGLLEQPVSVPVSRAGIEQVERMLANHVGVPEPVIAVEATGSLHRAFVADLERRHPGSTRLFAPSETKAARTQLGSGRFKTGDRDCAALTYLVDIRPVSCCRSSRS